MNSLLPAIAAQFGLSGVQFIKIDTAVLSQVYILDNAYVLRGRQLSDDTIEKLQREQDFIEAARPLISSIKLPQLSPITTGELFYVYEGWVWTAYPLIEGKILCNWWELEKLSRVEEEVTFRTLAKIHSDTKGKLSAVAIKSEYRFLAEIQHKLTDLKGEIPSAEYIRLEQALERTNEAERGLAEKDFGFVHGDYHPGNFVYKEERIVGLLDLDWSRKGCHLEDLAYTLVTFLRDCRDDYFKLDEEKFSRYISWYGLPEADVAVLKEYILLYALYDLHGFINLSLSTVNQKHLIVLQKSMLSEMCNIFKAET